MRLFKGILVLTVLIWIVSFGYAQDEQKVLVVYYSRDGHTKQVAEALAKRFNADIERLIDTKKRIGPIAMPAAGKDAVTGKLTRLQPIEKDPANYDIILLGTPSWFSNPTPAIRTYVVKNDLSKKKVGVFGTAHLTGIEECLQELAELVSKENAVSIPRLPLRHRDLTDTALSQKIDEFYQEVFKK